MHKIYFIYLFALIAIENILCVLYLSLYNSRDFYSRDFQASSLVAIEKGVQSSESTRTTKSPIGTLKLSTHSLPVGLPWRSLTIRSH